MFTSTLFCVKGHLFLIGFLGPKFMASFNFKFHHHALISPSEMVSPILIPLMTPFPFHHILFIIMGNMFSMHNAFNLSNKSLFNTVKFKLYDLLGVYWKTITFFNLPCVLGTMCSVNKVLVFCVYPHIVVLESHLSYVFWNCITHKRNKFCLFMLWTWILVIYMWIFLKHKRSN